ncbi:Gp19/Gp15/Gp42 family protein [Actinoalloteichus sp. GBA129-24]|uniref:Gp19/Gp15/Gp42 family protein n=1 Tax=Actinoalloteichus sp. GBA129-24 TaxID=1612551 RepID=UPI0009503F22|nr:Gp19/Gp15/Gp42 family protein [Actinoalloteichus sp. GBA129-24]APU20945.1 Phage protein Gp19/Gp15/Gp42 [Actinoalloteichus sp. GBA129-24]APU24194.1 Phage protein Gp19/Gp15/Gp42 [Actinoalloteichus sp. GBA129-24]
MDEPFATVEEFRARYSSGLSDERIAALLDDASELIRARRPRIDEWIASDRVRAGAVRAVVIQMVARAATAAETRLGLQSETVPEHSYALTTAAANGLYIMTAELADITPQEDAERAFSIIPG